MSVERMKLISLTGKEENLDYVIANILLNSGIQLEDALKVLQKGWKLTYYTYNSEIKELKTKVENIIKQLEIPNNSEKCSLKSSLDDIKENINKIDTQISDKFAEISEKQEEISNLNENIKPIEHLKNLNIELDKLYKLKYMNFRYGKLSQEAYLQVKNEMDTLDAVVYELEENEDEVWIMYFMPDTLTSKVDSYFQVLKFERIWLPDEVQGKPIDFLQRVKEEINKDKEEIDRVQNEIKEAKEKYAKELLMYKQQLELLEKINNVKKFMAHDNKGAFYIVGWIPMQNLKKILPQLDKLEIEYVIKNHDEVVSTPPTKLKNNILFKPFESIVKMYGTPNYTEMDPTVFVAITAFIMFGFMFGDVGQGAVILVIGLILSKLKKSLGPIFIAGGISAIIFGFVYGSVFGSEDIIKGILPSPMDNITNMLIYGIATGAILIIIAMIFNIKNGLKNKDLARVFFDKNGLAGIVFYITVLLLIVGLLLNGQMAISLSICLVLIILPLVLILFKDKIDSLLNKKKEKQNVSIIEKIFELIEMLLNIASNTISFVRLAAFAINHVGLCMAVYILGNMIGGSGSYIVIAIGNVLVIALEGLIVAIQVLRLEYYELFSRFYAGDGKEYTPIEVQ